MQCSYSHSRTPTAPRTRQFLRVALLLAGAVLLSGCNSSPLRFPGVYRLDIPQGNIITQEQVDQLRPGLTKRQVNFILGTPLVRDTFDQDRWDYIYSFQPGGGERVQERLTVHFADGELVSFDGDFQQSPDKRQFEQAGRNSSDSSNTTASTR